MLSYSVAIEFIQGMSFFKSVSQIPRHRRGWEALVNILAVQNKHLTSENRINHGIELTTQQSENKVEVHTMAKISKITSN
jgi:hypothetical protein